MDESFPRARLVVDRCPKAGQTATLSPDEAGHARARRLTCGDAVTLVDGSGVLARGRILSLTRSGGDVAVEAVIAAVPTGCEVDLLISGLRLPRLSWVVEKATELGAARLTLVSTERTQSFRASPATVSRLTRVAREAAKQSESTRWPKISGPLPLEKALSRVSTSRLFLDLEGASFPEVLGEPVSILVGPEGGWSASERAAALRANWSLVTLPAGRLRAETAAIAALVLARAAVERAGRR